MCGCCVLALLLAISPRARGGASGQNCRQLAVRSCSLRCHCVSSGPIRASRSPAQSCRNSRAGACGTDHALACSAKEATLNCDCERRAEGRCRLVRSLLLSGFDRTGGLGRQRSLESKLGSKFWWFRLSCYSKPVRPEIEQVVRLIQHKDSQSLEEALALLQDTVFSFSMKVCGQRQDAEDTMQEVLLTSVPNLPKFDSPKALMVWLYKVAKNRCLMSRRKSLFAPKKDLSLEELMPDHQELQKLSGSPEGTPETSLLRRENARHLREAVQKLPPDYRLILVLHDMEDLSDGDVAEITGLRPGTIRVRLHRARLFVRKELAKQDAHRIRRQTAMPSGEMHHLRTTAPTALQRNVRRSLKLP